VCPLKGKKRKKGERRGKEKNGKEEGRKKEGKARGKGKENGTGEKRSDKRKGWRIFALLFLQIHHCIHVH